jgi:hypothetical protein
MDTDETERRLPDLTGGSNTAFLLKEETHAIIGCAFEVLNTLGHGLNDRAHLFWSPTPCATGVQTLLSGQLPAALLPFGPCQSVKLLFVGPVLTSKPC